MAITAAGTGLTFDYINNSIATVVQSRESALLTQIGNLGESPTTADLLAMQQQVQQWTMTTQIQSTLVKEISDALKSIIQKSA
ncbi:MAG: type III secretion protein [Rhodocyclaceae bacterium]|nr:type III secretion protein [Rhodocyclaceae bacterium]